MGATTHTPSAAPPYIVSLDIGNRRVELDLAVDAARWMPQLGGELEFDPDDYNLRIQIRGIRDVFRDGHTVMLGALPQPGYRSRAAQLLGSKKIFDLPQRCPHVRQVREVTQERRET
ncbi:hypothetical protein [Nocardia sp. NPDC057030]|uniref:hypothetical protein n=1 Tax=unclassified Nocardia TaxID=2637762 RepID=UPI00363695F1